MSQSSEIYQFLEKMADIIRAKYPSLPVYVENQGDLEFETKNALAKQGEYCLFRIPEMNYDGNVPQDEKKISLSIPNIMVQVCEEVTINRSKNNLINNLTVGIAAQDLSIEIAKLLGIDFSGYMTLENISNDYTDNLMISTVSFATTIILSV